ncbi:hypothetical protein BH09VER1_BH09VER1_26150 [soil metagenome]
MGMIPPKAWALAAGVVLCVLGMDSLPRALGTDPQRNLSLFNNFADLGIFTHVGTKLVAAGLLVIILSRPVSGLLKRFHRTGRYPLRRFR